MTDLRFTDDDLKQLKEKLTTIQERELMSTLLARLEAAEAYGSMMAGLEQNEHQENLWVAWRKAAGKDG